MIFLNGKLIDTMHRDGGRWTIKLPKTEVKDPQLDILVEGIEDVKDPRRSKMYFLRRVPRDPMEPNVSVSAADSWAKRAYASEASDPKEGDDVYDVMSRSAKTGLNGVAYAKW